jgi:hypothetical protein
MRLVSAAHSTDALCENLDGLQVDEFASSAQARL